MPVRRIRRRRRTDRRWGPPRRRPRPAIRRLRRMRRRVRRLDRRQRPTDRRTRPRRRRTGLGFRRPPAASPPMQNRAQFVRGPYSFRDQPSACHYYGTNRLPNVHAQSPRRRRPKPILSGDGVQACGRASATAIAVFDRAEHIRCTAGRTRAFVQSQGRATSPRAIRSALGVSR